MIHSTKPEVVGRALFVRRLMKDGFKYVDACRAYESLMSTLAYAVTNGAYISLGNVGSLTPVVIPPRPIRMGFVKVKGGGCEKQSREYFLDARVKYKFKIHKAFMQKHQLHWTPTENGS